VTGDLDGRFLKVGKHKLAVEVQGERGHQAVVKTEAAVNAGHGGRVDVIDGEVVAPGPQVDVEECQTAVSDPARSHTEALQGSRCQGAGFPHEVSGVINVHGVLATTLDDERALDGVHDRREGKDGRHLRMNLEGGYAPGCSPVYRCSDPRRSGP